MKKQFRLTLLLLLIFLDCFSQAPQGINYQAVVRGINGQPLAAGTVVSMRFTIHESSANGTSVFQEIDTPTTNQFGLVTVVIGRVSSLAPINWGNGAKYLQVEIDPNGGSNFIDMGTSQLMSVPYALFAGNAANGITGATGMQGPTGATGLQGFNGATGATGPAGADGPQGTRGVTGAAGITGPAGQNGINGINGATGETGQNGTNGSNGAVGATGATGQNGTNGLNGATGATGQNGTNGSNGSTGATGATGQNGTNGLNGATGATGQNGTNGSNGATGVPGATGENGTNGSNGATGATGATGQNGIDGTNGATGATGATGQNGTNGSNGATGATGQNGINGTNGATGATGQNGTNGLTGATGVTGQNGMNGSNGAMGATGATGQNGTNGINGATGQNGTNGSNGSTGATGATGQNGTNGLNGTTGATGQNGTNGSDGATGATGATGQNGTNGLNGATGATGQNGTNGSNGATGATGQNGTNGSNGATGATGQNGTNGSNGSTGATGATGQNGTNGSNGATGATGQDGTNGSNGAIGSTGATGQNGTNGLNGATGATGQDGTNGSNGEAGATGATGNGGATGQTGSAGATGPTGANGATGVTGAQGATGATGPTGSSALFHIGTSYIGVTSGKDANGTSEGTSSNLYNMFIGDSAGYNITTGANNIALGYAALKKNTSANFNVAIGTEALSGNTTGGNNVSVGNFSMQANTSGTDNTAFGQNSLGANTSGGDNVAFGNYSLSANTSGLQNLALGLNALSANTTGQSNVAVGNYAGKSITTSSSNTFIGYSAGQNDTGYNNVFIGVQAGYNERGNDKLYISNSNTSNPLIYGNFANKHLTINDSLTSKYFQMTNGAANGYVLQSDSNGNASWVSASDLADTMSLIASSNGATRIETEQTNDSTIHFTLGGTEYFEMQRATLAVNNSGKCVYMGNAAGLSDSYSLTSGHRTFNGENTGIGANALQNINTTNGGILNTAIGSKALQNATSAAENTAAGYEAGHSDTTGDHNTYLGAQADAGANGLSYATAIGAGAVVSKSNSIVIGNGDNVGIGTSTPDTTLHIVGKFKYQDGTQANGYLLQSDSNGNASWVSTTTGLGAVRFIGSSYIGINSGFGGTGTSEGNASNRSNINMGNQAGNGNVTGIDNIALGDYAMYSNDSLNNMIAIGQFALNSASKYYAYPNTGGDIAIGQNALGGAQSGANTAVGFQAGQHLGNAFYNTIVGYQAFSSLFTSGNNNCVFGYQSLYKNSANNNSAFGYKAGQTNTNGSSNTFIGSQADASSGSLSNATAVGANALVNESNALVLGNNAKVGIGTSAPDTTLHVVGKFKYQDGTQSNGYVLQSDSNGNASWTSASGSGAIRYFNSNYLGITSGFNPGIGIGGNDFDNILIGDSAGNSFAGTGIKNIIAIGGDALRGFGGQYSFESGNIAIGGQAMSQLGDGQDNVAIGYKSLSAYNNFSGNTSIGNFSLKNTQGNANSAIGYQAGQTNNGGNNNTFIGYQADAAAGSFSNATAIGANAIVGESNALILGNGANVGIGTSTPSSLFHENGGNFLVTGTFGSGTGIEASGAGTRMFFNPKTAAFRTGNVTGTDWDSSNLGNYSFSAGQDNIASGAYSAAFGYSNAARGYNSFAAGEGNSTYDSNAVVFGAGNTAYGNNSFAAGNNNSATGTSAAVFGGNNFVPADDGFAAGSHNSVTATNAAAFGNNNSVYGYSAFGAGSNNAITGTDAVGLGSGNQVYTNNAFAAGLGNYAISYSEIALGMYNTVDAVNSNNAWNASDRIFSVGNGSSSSSRSNAITILKSGFTGIGTEAPDTTLVVAGKFKYKDGTQANGYVLQSDANGKASWVDPATLNSDWTTSGSNIYNNNSGHVGIGTSTPYSALSIKNDTIQLRLSPVGNGGSSTSLPSYIDMWSTFDQFSSDQGPRRTATIVGGFSGGTWSHEFMGFNVGVGGANDVAALPTERMRITGSGAVGIGTTSPISQLANTPTNIIASDGHGITGNSLTWAVNSSGYTAALYDSSTAAHSSGLAVKIAGTAGTNRLLDLSTGSSQGTSGTTVMAVQGDGNVGIGTGTPASTLEVNGSVGAKFQSGLTAGTTNPDATGTTWQYTSGTGTITLPAAGSCTNRVYVIMNQTGGSRAISGYHDTTNTAQTSVANNTILWLQSNGINWYQIK